MSFEHTVIVALGMIIGLLFFDTAQDVSEETMKKGKGVDENEM